MLLFALSDPPHVLIEESPCFLILFKYESGRGELDVELPCRTAKCKLFFFDQIYQILSSLS